LGRAGQLYEQADTQTIYSPLGGVLQTRSGSPSGKAVSGTIVGGMASEAGRVLQADAGQLPPKQVLISKSSAIGIQFLEPVLSTDDVESTPAPAPDGTQASQLAVRPLPPSAPPSPESPESLGATPYLRPAESKLTGQ
jgi:intracellular multiplication protein IcmE